MCSAALLSCKRVVGTSFWESSCALIPNSHEVFAVTLYSDSTLDLDTTSYFILFQGTKFPPINIQYFKGDFLSKGASTQSASENPSTHMCPW